MKAHHLLLAAAAVAFASTAGAQNLKPGLWEITNNMQAAGGGEMDAQRAQMQQQMANMPPEQRKMMEDMMAQRGMKPGGPGGPGGMTLKVCMTKEMVEKNELPAQQGDCKTTHQSRSGKTMKMAFTCTNPPSSGEGQVVFNSPESYSTKMTVSSHVKGKPEKMNMDGSGKWVAADCGNVKPMAAAKK